MSAGGAAGTGKSVRQDAAFDTAMEFPLGRRGRHLAGPVIVKRQPGRFTPRSKNESGQSMKSVSWSGFAQGHRLLKEAGFAAAASTVSIVRTHICIDSTRQLWEMLIAGTVRLSTTLRSQPAAKAGAIGAAIERGMAPYRDGAGYRLPIAAILGTAARQP